MIGGALVAGVVGAALSGGGALAAGHSVAAACGFYMAGGTASLLLVLAAGSRGRNC